MKGVNLYEPISDYREALGGAELGSGGLALLDGDSGDGDRPLHISGQKPAVSAGIGAELLFIQRLEIVQGLLGRIAELPVGIPLEGRQVIEGGRLLRFFFPLHRADESCLAFAGIRHRLGLRFPSAS